ncbi:TPA: IS110 family transposase, partial [Neisseria meningitidis]
ELGRLSHKRIASLAGIAPHPRESGETKFKSRCFGGRSTVRKALYMATVAATRFEPLIRDFHQRPLSEGKPYKVAVTACMRKLLETFAKFLSLPTAETQTQVFVYFRS